MVIYGGQILHRVSHYFFRIRFKASRNYLDKLPKNLQYGEREIFSTDSHSRSGIPIRHSCCPGNISPISRKYTGGESSLPQRGANCTFRSESPLARHLCAELRKH